MNEEWNVVFYETRTGKKPIENYIDRLPAEEIAQVEKEVRLLEELGPFVLGEPHVKYLDNKIWEVRIRGKNQHRILWFIFQGRNIFLLHAFPKKQDTIERRHLDIAYRRMEDIIKRYGGN